MVLPWFPAFAMMVFGPAILQREFPGSLAKLGSESLQSWYVFLPSLSFLHALSTGSWTPAVISLSILAFAVVVAVWLLSRWYRIAHREIILDEGSTAAPLYSSAFALGKPRFPFGSDSVSGAFWVKDVLLPVRRSTAAYVQQLAFALSGSVIAVVFLHLWSESRTEGAGITCFILTLITLAVPLLFSAYGCLPSLGMEGNNIALLRPVLGVWRLLFAKASAQVAFVLIHSLFVAVLIGVGAKLAGLSHPGVTTGLALALVGSLAFSAIGLALGFGLPDFQRKSMALPGASKLAQLFHMMFGAVVALTWSLLATAYTFEKMGSVGLFAGVAVTLGVVLTVSAALGAWSLRHLERLEI